MHTAKDIAIVHVVKIVTNVMHFQIAETLEKFLLEPEKATDLIFDIFKVKRILEFQICDFLKKKTA